MLRKWLRKKKLKAACLAAGLATAWGGANETQATYRINGWAEPDQPLAQSVFIVQYYRVNASDPFQTLHVLGDLAGGARTNFAFNLDDDPLYGEVTDVSRYMLIGLHDDQNDGVAISLKTDTAIQNGDTWEAYFDNYPSYTETRVADWLDVLDANAISELEYMMRVLSWSSQYFAETAPIVNFSTATANGTAYGEARFVPEPTALMMIAPGLALLALRRRRKDDDPQGDAAAPDTE